MVPPCHPYVLNSYSCRTFEELWDDDGETERERNKLISEVYNFVDIPTVTVGNEDEMPLISFGTGPAVENETRWEIKEAIQSGHRCGSTGMLVQVLLTTYSTLMLDLEHCQLCIMVCVAHLDFATVIGVSSILTLNLLTHVAAGTLTSAPQDSWQRSRKAWRWPSWKRWCPGMSCGSQQQ